MNSMPICGLMLMQAKLLPASGAKELLSAVGFAPSDDFERLVVPAELPEKIMADRAVRALSGLGGAGSIKGRRLGTGVS